MHIIYNIEKLASILGITSDSLIGAIEQSKRKNWTDEEHQTLMKLREAGASFDDIATQLGRPASSVRTKFYKLRADWDFDPQLYGQHLGALQAKVDYTRVFRDFYGTKEAEAQAYVDKHSKAKRSPEVTEIIEAAKRQLYKEAMAYKKSME